MIISIIRVKPSSTMASSRIALWLARQLQVPLVSTRAELAQALVEQPRNIPFVIIVNGPIVFCNFDDLIEQIVVNRTRKIVYVQNDYAIEVLKRTGNPDQKNRMRAAMNRFKGDLSYWTSVEATLARAPDTSTLVNWNALTWKLPRVLVGKVPRRDRRVLYYGAFRKGRLPSFDRYFGADPGRYYLSTTKTGMKQFRERYPDLSMGPNVQDVIEEFRGKFSAGLLIADNLSNKVYHCPPNRWYEMLSMDIPILVDRPCVPTLERAGYRIDDAYVVESSNDVSLLPSYLRKVSVLQAQFRKRDPRPQLRKELGLAMMRSRVAL